MSGWDWLRKSWCPYPRGWPSALSSVKAGLVQASEGGPHLSPSRPQTGFLLLWLFLLEKEGSPGNVGAGPNKCWDPQLITLFLPGVENVRL